MEIKTSGDDRSIKLPWRARALRISALTALVAVLSSAATYQVTTKYFFPSFSTSIWEYVQSRGHAVFQGKTPLRDKITWPLRHLVSSEMFQSATLPEILIDIKFKHIRKLQQKRDEALTRGLLINGPNDFVPASIRHGGRTTKVKVRLKGDLPDHLEGSKWSFRIHVKGKEHIFGMRRFSIQNPQVRGFQGEVLFKETLRHVGVLAPRYFFVNVTLNGNSIGVMAVEEHFSKELLESNQRREGVIVSYD
jgi:hypothetical protein